MIVDTHCHLYFDAFDADREDVIKRALEFNVKYMVNVGTDPATNEASRLIAQGRDYMKFTAGLHPHHSNEVDEAGFAALEEYARREKPAAIGEIGLDYFKSEADPETQKKTFARMLRLAAELKLPVIVHSRNAFRDTVDIIKAETGGALRGVMHCFSYDRAAMEELFSINFLVSFTCNVTFKNAGPLLDVAKAAPAGRFMLETDSPYLAPQIYRGKRNEPCCLAHLAQFLAELRGETVESLESHTTRTALEFFGFDRA